MKYCKTCGKKVAYDNLTGYCFKCYKEKQSAEKINNWLRTGDAGIGVSTTLRGCIRDFILKSQNGCCNICGMSDSWNGKNLVFILDHIDGDASNNCRENLRLICPNCDSQLPTYKSKNKHSARTYRKAA